MSFGTFWGTDPTDAATYEKILGRYLEGGAATVPPLNAVLGVGNSAANQSATDFNVVGAVSVETGLVEQGNQAALRIGGAGDNLQILGATAKGTLLVGDGVNTQSLPLGADGLVLKAASGLPLGVEWAVDGGGAGVSDVVAIPNSNIFIGGTVANPTVGVSNPCNATLALGTQDLTAVNGFDSSTINANGLDTLYFEAGVAATNADLIGNAGGATLFLSGSNLAAAQAHSLTVEAPVVGGAFITHATVSGAVRDLGINTQGNLTLAGDNIDLSTAGRLILPSLAAGDFYDLNPTLGKMSITTDNAGGALNPIVFLQNTNATGSVALEVYKNKPSAGAVGDALFTQSVFGKDSGNAKQEYTRITHTIRDPTATSEEGSIEMGCFIGGTYANMIQLNGNDTPAGEVNILRPIDLSTGSGGLIKVSGTGSDALNLATDTSQGVGNINITAKANANASLITSGTGRAELTNGATTLFVNQSGMTYAGGAVSLTTTGNIALTTTGGGDTNINSADQINLTSTTGGINITSGGSGNLTLQTQSFGDVILTAEDSSTITGKTGLTLRTTLGAGADINMVSTRDLNITTDNTVGKIVLTGTKLQSNTSGGSSGEHLVITLNGVVYKIALLNP